MLDDRRGETGPLVKTQALYPADVVFRVLLGALILGAALVGAVLVR
jgi:hypothetical protein